MGRRIKAPPNDGEIRGMLRPTVFLPCPLFVQFLVKREGNHLECVGGKIVGAEYPAAINHYFLLKSRRNETKIDQIHGTFQVGLKQ